MAVIDGRLDLTVKRDDFLRYVDRQGTLPTEVTVESLADATHETFCIPNGFARLSGVAAEIHRRQHVEQSKAILERHGRSGR